MLFLEFSKLLTKNFAVSIVDFADGYMAKRIPEGVEFVDFEKVISYPADSVVVLQSVPFYRIVDFDKFDEKTRFFCWNLHPANFEPMNLIFEEKKRSWIKKNALNLFLKLREFNKNKLAKTIKWLSKNNALYFMDYENYRTTKSFYPWIDIQARYLPCFLSPRTELKIQGSEKASYHLCWVGRIVDFKLHILLHILKRLGEEAKRIDAFEFTIIGSGDQNVFLKDQIILLKLPFMVNFIENLPSEKLGGYLVKNCDVLFGMGLSALEGASRCIPTFLVDFSYIEIIGNYRFKLVSEHEKFNLGSEINQSHLEDGSTFGDKLKYLFNNYNETSAECYNYWKVNHSGKRSAEIFMSSIEENTAFKKEIKKRRLHKADVFTFLYFASQKILHKKKSGGVHGFQYPSAYNSN